jgi:hypothetical protein
MFLQVLVADGVRAGLAVPGADRGLGGVPVVLVPTNREVSDTRIACYSPRSSYSCRQRLAAVPALDRLGLHQLRAGRALFMRPILRICSSRRPIIGHFPDPRMDSFRSPAGIARPLASIARGSIPPALRAARRSGRFGEHLQGVVADRVFVSMPLRTRDPPSPSPGWRRLGQEPIFRKKPSTNLNSEAA